jgi:hypothetical protein
MPILISVSSIATQPRSEGGGGVPSRWRISTRQLQNKTTHEKLRSVKQTSILIMTLVAAHLLTSCNESSTSSSSSSSSSASELVGTWKDEKGFKIQLADGGTMTTVRPGDNLKHDGNWTVSSDGRLQLELKGPSGGAIPLGTFSSAGTAKTI